MGPMIMIKVWTITSLVSCPGNKLNKSSKYCGKYCKYAGPPKYIIMVRNILINISFIQSGKQSQIHSNIIMNIIEQRASAKLSPPELLRGIVDRKWLFEVIYISFQILELNWLFKGCNYY